MLRKTKGQYFQQLKRIATANNITLLSKEYVNNKNLLLFRCNNENCRKEWYDSRANIIRRKLGFKCPKCGGGINRHYSIEDLNEIAAKKPGGGRCLSKKFRGTKKYHLWKCFNCGNKWFAKPRDIIGKTSRPQGTWCPKCSIGITEEICRLFFEEIFNKRFHKEYKLDWLIKRKMHLDGFNDKLKIATEYHGKQHYKMIPHFHPSNEDFKAYQKRDEYKRKMCIKNGIKLIEVGYITVNGKLHKIKLDEMEDYITSECKKKNISLPSRKKKINWKNFKVANPGYLEELKEIAISKGGKCLSKYWFGANEYHDFVCSEGHFFKATPNKIKGTPKRAKGTWCPKCKYKHLPQNQVKYSKKDLDDLALERGGPGSKCLSSKYTGYHQKYKWQCTKGHVFYARFDSIKGYPSKPKGTWCKKCSIIKRTKK